MWTTLTTLRENKWKTLAGILCLSGYIYYKRNAQVVSIERDKMKEQTRKMFFSEAQTSSDATLRNSFLPQLSERLKELMDIKNTLSSLRQVTDKDEKAELWRKLKAQAFAHAVASSYGVCILFLLLRIGTQAPLDLPNVPEINIICHYNYLDQVNHQCTITSAVQEKYLLYTNYVMKQGLELLVSQIEDISKQVLEDWSLPSACTKDDTRKIMASIKTKFEASIENLSPRSYFLPAEDVEDDVKRHLKGVNGTQLSNELVLKLLLNETRNLLESQQFETLFRECFEEAFVILNKTMDELHKTVPEHITLVKLLPHVISQASSTLLEAVTERLVFMPSVTTFCEDIFYGPGQASQAHNMRKSEP